MKAFLGALVLASLIVVPGSSVSGDQALPLRVQPLVSAIGDFDCFGLGVPQPPASLKSPCGALAGTPVQEPEEEGDPALVTDALLACPTPSVITLTHTFDLPDGATILGAVWAMNLADLEKENFNTIVTLDGFIPVPVPNLGAAGTQVIFLPLVPPLTTVLEDGQLVVRIFRGGRTGCDDLAVDGSFLAVAYRAP